MFEEFQKEVLDTYLRMKKRHELPSDLENLTRSNLKRYALWVLANRYKQKDDEAIRRFFDQENQYADHEERIRRFELDKFRPLVSFLNEETERPDERIVKILAWLIDFEPRPYAAWQRARRDEIRKPNDGDSSPTLPNPPPPPPPPFKGCQLTIYIAIAITIGIGAFFLAYKQTKQCMYWKEDRYIAVNCRENIIGAEIIAKDNQLLKNFRKITRPDTLTAQHVNKVWYSKINNTVEFFTGPGFHPVHRDRSLKAVTMYIIEQYAQEKNDGSEK